MKILMLTNTYLPHIGGVARSVAGFADAFEQLGHEVLIVAPTFDSIEPDAPHVIRVPAIQHFNGSDFSVRLPIPGLLTDVLHDFHPEIVHAHHPFLLGDTALRIAARRNLPLVFTHHTMYERYTHYVPGDSPALERFVTTLATQYANLTDYVIAPSASIAKVLRERGVTAPITAIPTGIDAAQFATGDGAAARRAAGAPAEAFVVGHVGRLAEEKNLGLLADAVAQMLAEQPQAHFIIVGSGPAEDDIRQLFSDRQLTDRLHMTGSLEGQALVDAYHAMDVFAFASRSETQGMVLAEAMTAGVPVVAIDASGVREVVRDGDNGYLLFDEDAGALGAALVHFARLAPAERAAFSAAARETAEEFAMPARAQQLLDVYEQALLLERQTPSDDSSRWAATLRRIEEEWNLWACMGQAVSSALLGSDSEPPRHSSD